MLDELENNREAGIAHTVPADRPCGRPKLSRYRNIHCLIWNDDKFPFLSDDARLVWFHLFTNPITTPIGIYKASLSGLAEEIHWPLARYKKAFAECSRNLLVRFDERCHVVLFPQFFKWNKPANPNVLSSWVKCYEELPNCDLKIESIQSIREHSMQWGEPFAKVTINLSETLPLTLPKQQQYQEQEQQQEKEQDTHTSPSAQERGFSAKDLFDLWNEEAPKFGLSRCLRLDSGIGPKLNSRLKEHPEREFWVLLLQAVGQSPFLLGKGDNGWKVSLDWVVKNPQNTRKIAQGDYANRKLTPGERTAINLSGDSEKVADDLFFDVRQRSW